jgi:hypothetical protein
MVIIKRKMKSDHQVTGKNMLKQVRKHVCKSITYINNEILARKYLLRLYISTNKTLFTSGKV